MFQYNVDVILILFENNHFLFLIEMRKINESNGKYHLYLNLKKIEILDEIWLAILKRIPTPGIEPGPPGWEPDILTTRPCRRTAY